LVSPFGVVGKAPGRGSAKEEVEGCCVSGFLGREDFRSGGEGGGGGIDVPAVSDSVVNGMAGSWNEEGEGPLAIVAMIADGVTEPAVRGVGVEALGKLCGGGSER
jgi:hypothetical protein